MKVGTLIRLSKQAASVYGFDSTTGLIVDKVPQKIH